LAFLSMSAIRLLESSTMLHSWEWAVAWRLNLFTTSVMDCSSLKNWSKRGSKASTKLTTESSLLRVLNFLNRALISYKFEVRSK
jgi:hypothetical protein